MMTLLIVIGLFLLFWYYLLPWLLRRQIRKTFGFDPRSGQRQKQQQQPQPQEHKKKIDPTIGEYVEFTETITQERIETPEGEETSTNIEQQITDIQWEDLPPKESES